MRSLDRFLAANEKLLKILVFSKNFQNTSKSFQTADLFTNVTMKYGKIVVCWNGGAVESFDIWQKKMMSLLPTEITRCCIVLYDKLIFC